MKLPDLEKIDSVKETSKTNKDVLVKLLKNINNIKQIEKENNKLKEILVENQEILNKKKVDDLINLVNYKESKYKEFRENILDDYDKFKSNINKKIIHEQKHNFEIEKKYKELVIYLKKIKQENNYLKNNNIKTKFLLKKEFEKKINKISNEHSLYKHHHKTILKEYEIFKLNIKKQRELEKTKIGFLAKKNSELINQNIILEKDNIALKNINKNMLLEIKKINHESIGNKQVLDDKITEMRKELEYKLRQLTKQHLDKEIEYKAKINSLEDDLKRYYIELRKLKEKYFNREKELKEKIKNLF